MSVYSESANSGTIAGGATTDTSAQVPNVKVTATINGQNYPLTLSGNQYMTQGFTFTANPTIDLKITFPQDGHYGVNVALANASDPTATYGEDAIPLTIGGASISGTAYMADGKTVLPNAYLHLVNRSTNDEAWAPTDANGNFTVQLTDGTWNVDQIELNSGPYTFNSGQQPTITVTGGQVTAFDGQNSSTVAIDDLGANVKGTAYIDGAKTQPLANGYLDIQMSSTTSSDANGSGSGANNSASDSTTAGNAGPQNDIWVPTDTHGNFVAGLTPGSSYKVVAEYSTSGEISTDDVWTIAPGIDTFSVTPPSPDVQLTVNDDQGQPVQSGSVAVMPATDNQDDWSNAIWMQVSDGKVSGYLPSGNYVAVAIATSTNFWSISTPLSVDATAQQPTAETVEPAQPLVRGTLTKADGKTPIASATIEIMPANTNDSSKAVYFSTDANGNFNDLGMTPGGQYGDTLQANQSYTVVGIWDSQGNWTPIGQPFQTAASASAAQPIAIKLPSPDLGGKVTLDGKVVTSGWIAFGPSGSTIDTNGQDWIWAPIQNGSYSTDLPAGSYQVYAIQNDVTGSYFDATQISQTPITISHSPTPVAQDITFAMNFSGTLSASAGSMGNATMMLSKVPNPETDSDWQAINYVQTDNQGNFSANIAPGTWYLVGVIDSTGQFTQLSQTLTVSAQSSGPQAISIAPNVSGTVTLPASSTTGMKTGWIVVQGTQSQQVFSAQLNQSGSNWNYSFNLPADTYKVLGLSLEDNSGGQNWTDLSAQDDSITVGSNQPATLNIDLGRSSHSGAVSGITGQTGYVLFEKADQNGAQKMVAVPFDATGQFTTVLDNSWQVVGVETAYSYHQVQGTYTNGEWSVTAQ